MVQQLLALLDQIAREDEDLVDLAVERDFEARRLSMRAKLERAR